MLRSCHIVRAAFSVVLLSTLNACGTDLGPCDVAAAERVIYKRGPDGDGCKFASGCDNNTMTATPPFEPVTFYVPYYAGQALAHASCGNGSVCHSATATGALRQGAPAGLDFDVGMRASILNYTAAHVVDRTSNAPIGVTGTAKLREWIEESWELIDDGVMPPGAVGEAAQAASKWFERVGAADAETFEKTETVLPKLSTPEGKEIMRNWLACGAPVATGLPLGQSAPPDVIEPTWDDIHSVVISDTCLACHAGRPEVSRNAGLVLSNACDSWKALYEKPASSQSLCATYSSALVTPFDPEGSLLYEKLEHLEPACGFMMPLNFAQLPDGAREAIRLWIMNGALPPSGCN